MGLGNLITPFLVQRLGPKMSMLTVALPLYALHWAGLVLCRPLPSLFLLLVSRGLAGVGIGLAISIVPNYVIDIASVQNQGLLGLLPPIMPLLLIFLLVIPDS